MTLAVGSRLGPYEVLSPLGAGGMGEVYGPGIRASTGRSPSRSSPHSLPRAPSEILPALKPPRQLSDFDLSADESFLLLLEDTTESDIWLMSTE